MEKTTNASFILMDEAQEMFRSGQIADGMTHVILGFMHLRNTCTADAWKHFAQLYFLQHPLIDLVHQDPFTRHSYEKPRQYAGNAELLDYIYGCRPVPPDTTELGREIFSYTTNSGAPQRVRARRDILREMLDDMADHPYLPRVLSIACGHLREAENSAVVMEGKIKEFIALDQDPLSLKLIRHEMAGYNISPVHGSVRDLLTDKLKYNELDFVYAAGLYDYLTQPVAARLTRIIFKMLRPGGRLLVANFAPSVRDIAYMETFMQWWLIYRDEEELAAVANEIPESAIGEKRCFRDEHRNIVFLEITKV